MARRHLLVASAALVLSLFVPAALGQASETGTTPDPCAESNREERGDLIDDESLCDLADTPGLLEALDEYATLVVGIVGLAVGLGVVWLVIVSLGMLWPQRYLRIVAEERVAEIDSGETARFTVTVENRLRRRPLGIVVQTGEPPTGWTTHVSMERPTESGFLEVFHGTESGVTLHGRKNASKNVLSAIVEVTAPPTASHEEWAELTITAIPYKRGEPKPRKSKSLQVITLLKEHLAKVIIVDVKHEPAEFRPGDAVTSSVQLSNRGNEPSLELPVTFWLNDKELETKRVNVQAGETRTVQFMWSAASGVNQVRIALGESAQAAPQAAAPA
jgi:hypothetical protein